MNVFLLCPSLGSVLGRKPDIVICIPYLGNAYETALVVVLYVDVYRLSCVHYAVDSKHMKVIRIK